MPVTLLINYYHYGVTTNGKVKLALAILLFGVGVATVTDVELRPLGLCFGLLAVLTTAVFQIWQGTKQKEFGISATQLQAGIAPWQSFQASHSSLITRHSSRITHHSSVLPTNPEPRSQSQPPEQRSREPANRTEEPRANKPNSEERRHAASTRCEPEPEAPRARSLTRCLRLLVGWLPSQALAVAAATEMYCGPMTQSAEGGPCDTALTFFQVRNLP